MASLDDLLSQIPIDQIAQQLGVDQATAESAVKSALPTLVGGLGANAQDPAGAASLESALRSHADTTLLDGGVDISKVDTGDGQKIVSNIFGSNTDQVASTLGGVNAGAGNDLVKQLLPILAPIVLAYLAKQFTGGGAGAGTQNQASGGGLGDLLGGLLGGGSGAGGGIGGALGGILGGSAGGGIGDLLGGLLGGGKR